MWVWVCFPYQSQAALPAEPGQSSVPPQSSACDLKAQFFPQLVSWITVIAQIVSLQGVRRAPSTDYYHRV